MPKNYWLDKGVYLMRDILLIIATFMMSIATIALALIAWRGLKGAAEEVHSLKQFYQKMFRPYVCLSLEQVKREEHTTHVLKFSNTGWVAASDIQFKVLENKSGIDWRQICLALGFGPNTNEALIEGLSLLTPGQTLTCAFRGNERRTFGGDEFVKSFPDPLCVQVTYRSVENEHPLYEEVFRVSPRIASIITLENIHVSKKTADS